MDEQLKNAKKSERLAAKKDRTKSASITEFDLSNILEEISSLRAEIKNISATITKDLKDNIAKQVCEELEKITKENLSLKDDLAVVTAANNSLTCTVKVQRREINELNEALYEVETNHFKLEQYTRRNNLEIAGISDKVVDTNLEHSVIEILNDVGINVKSEDIEACHRLPKTKAAARKNLPKRTIVRFVNRKNVVKALKNKKLLKEKRKGIYLNENLCSYYQKIWNTCRKLHREKKVHSFWTYNGTVCYRTTENGKVNKVEHMSDLDYLDDDLNDDREDEFFDLDNNVEEPATVSSGGWGASQQPWDTGTVSSTK